MSASTGAWLPYLFLLAGATFLQYLWGRRANWRIIRETAQACERALRPQDQTYTWIGGLIGYKADYVVRRGHLNRVEATLTALPRHSLLYLPISWAWRRHDTLYLLLRPNQPLRMRGHVYLVRPGLWRPRIPAPEELREEWLQVDGHRYRLLYSTSTSRELLRQLVQAARSPLVRHVSINPDEGALYCRMAARPDLIEPVVARLARLVEQL